MLNESTDNIPEEELGPRLKAARTQLDLVDSEIAEAERLEQWDKLVPLDNVRRAAVKVFNDAEDAIASHFQPMLLQANTAEEAIAIMKRVPPCVSKAYMFDSLRRGGIDARV